MKRVAIKYGLAVAIFLIFASFYALKCSDRRSHLHSTAIQSMKSLQFGKSLAKSGGNDGTEEYVVDLKTHVSETTLASLIDYTRKRNSGRSVSKNARDKEQKSIAPRKKV